MSVNPFDPNAVNTPPKTTEVENPLEVLVGEGKKFSTPEELAKGKLEADRFIEQLQSEAAEMRNVIEQNETDRNSKIDRLLESLNAPKADNTQHSKDVPEMNTTPQVPENTQGSDATDAKVDIESTIDKLLSQRDAQRSKQQNIESVTTKMNELYGDRSAAMVKQTADQMGVTTEWLEYVAGENPKAFFKLVGAEDKKGAQQSLATQQSNTNFEGQPSSNETVRDQAWWNTQRKTQGNSWFFKPKTQQAYWEDAKSLGSRFLNNSN